MNANLVNILMWNKPHVSGAYLVGINFLCWFFNNQRPICAIAWLAAIFYMTNLWKHRIRPEVLVDPPDSEDWVNLTTYDMEKNVFDFGKSMWQSWILMRKENYFMWLALTSLFWVTMAKVASHVSFTTILFLVANTCFCIGPLLRHFNVEFTFKQCDESALSDDLLPEVPSVEQPVQQKSIAQRLFENSFGSHASSSSEVTPESRRPEDRERSGSPSAGPESLTPYGAKIPSHEDSSEDEFLFDAKHFESSSSSTSNSFELLHF